MTYIIEHFGKAMTAIAAVLAFSTTQSFAQDASAPPDPVTGTSVETPETVDPLAPEPVVGESPVATDAVVPLAPKPKVETSTAATQRAKPSASGSAARSKVRRASATAPAATAATPAVEAAAPTPLPAEPQPRATAEPAAPLIAEPSPASDTPNTLMSDLMAEPMLPVAGAALGLIALGGAGIAMRRRKRRREDEEFEARQQALAVAEAEPTLELGPADKVRPGPVFARAPAPVHDPVPERKAPVAPLPNGFDLSRFGPHVQAAYRGPTADNPSVSLEYRLRRAASLDEQEHMLAEQGESKADVAAG